MKLFLIKSESENPYINLAIEELLFQKMMNKVECILFFAWKNTRSVIIGRNQNPYIECDLDLMRRDGVRLVRRKTGGGAVYHDSGNLNYTFIASGGNADRHRWNMIICDAIATYGLNCSEAGRNDFHVNGKKISGSAYRKEGETFLQHGTLMVNVDIEALRRYLTPQKSKLLKNGVRSVDQRVCNLSELNSVITVNSLEETLIHIVKNDYRECEIEYLRVEEFLDNKKIGALSDEYSSNRFIFGDFSSDDEESDDGL